MSKKFTQTEQNLISTAQSILEERGYTVTEVTRDSYSCPNVMIENPHGQQYPDATGAVLYPSGATNADKFEFHWS